jgi:hypothetical protein
MINVEILFLFAREEPEKLLEKFKLLVYSRKLHDEWANSFKRHKR